MQRGATRPAQRTASRKRVYDIIAAQPGSCIQDLCVEATLYWAGAEHHVKRLTSAGLVRTIRVGRRRLLFTSEALEEIWAEERGLLAEPTCRKVALQVVETPGRSILELSRAARASERATYHHVKRLSDAGLVRTLKPRYYQEIHATGKLLAVLFGR